jgi:nucleoside-diphosphate-sugar epimerase
VKRRPQAAAGSSPISPARSRPNQPSGTNECAENLDAGHGPGDDPYLDTTRLTHDTGFAPTFDVATAVADYVAWRTDNPR